MSLSVWAKKCPECESEDLFEMFRVEAGELITNETDFAVYKCRGCDLEFDQFTHPITGDTKTCWTGAI